LPDEESRRHSLQRRIVHEGSPIMAGSLPKKFGTPDHVQVEVCETPPGREGGRSRRGTFSGLARYFSTEDVDVGDQPFISYSPLAESSMIMVRGGYKRRNGAIVLVRLSDAVLLDCAQQVRIWKSLATNHDIDGNSIYFATVSHPYTLHCHYIESYGL
jgi:hypothetical protein